MPVPDFGYLPTDDDRKAARLLAKRIGDRDWAAFVGAGASSWSGLPLGSDLVAQIEAHLSLPPATLDRTRLAIACSRLEHTESRASLVAFLQQALSTVGRDPSSCHQALLGLEPKHILTTNPDDLLERAMRSLARPYCAVARASDWRNFRQGETVPIIKLHGDISQPDTLVFTEQDYVRYPNDEQSLYRADLATTIARCSLLFVGYALADYNLLQVIQWVQDRLGSRRRQHYFVVDAADTWKRREFEEQYNILIIAIGDYANTYAFLRDLGDLANHYGASTPIPPSAAGHLPSIPPLLSARILELFRDRYNECIAAVEQWRMSEAAQTLQTILHQLQSIAETHPSNPEMRDFQQQVLLALSSVQYWGGDRASSLATAETAHTIGPLSIDRAEHAALVFATLGATTHLAAILTEFGKSLPGFQKLTALKLALEGNLPGAAALIPGDTDDFDLLLIAARAATAALAEDSVAQAAGTLDWLWAHAGTNPVASLAIAQLTDELLRRVVDDRLHADALDRRLLVKNARTRYRDTIDLCVRVSDQLPELLLDGLASAIAFSQYLREDETASSYRQKLSSLSLSRHASVAATNFLKSGELADVETIDRLYTDGFLTHARRAIFLSQLLARGGKPEEAERILGDALNAPASDDDRDAILETLVRVLVEGRRYSECSALIATQRPTAELGALLQAMIALRSVNEDVAIGSLRLALVHRPRSRLLLEQLIALLVRVARQQESTDRREAVLEEALQAAVALAAILPSPKSELTVAYALNERGRHIDALQIVEAIDWSSEPPLEATRFQSQLLVDVGRPKDAAELIEGAAHGEQADDYHLQFNCGIAWARADEIERAIDVLSKLLEHPQADSSVHAALGQLYLLRRPQTAENASRAFDHSRRAFELNPGDAVLPLRIWLSGQASGRGKEAWAILGTLDLTTNPYFRAMDQDQALQFIAERNDILRRISDLQAAGVVPFEMAANHASRSQWLIWHASCSRFREELEAGNHPRPRLMQLPTTISKSMGNRGIRQGVLLDLTAVVTLGTHGIFAEVIQALHQANVPLWLFSGAAKWFEEETRRLRIEQMPWHRRRYCEIESLLSRSRNNVRFADLPNEDFVWDGEPPAVGARIVDAGCAVAASAYYLDDFVPDQEAAKLPNGTLIGTADLLAALVRRGLVGVDDASRLQEGELQHVIAGRAVREIVLDRPILAAEEALLASHDAGLLRRWARGGEGWPPLIVGPCASADIRAQAREADWYQEALERIEAAGREVTALTGQGVLKEMPPRVVPQAGITIESFWFSALANLTDAHSRSLTLWSDDLFTSLLLDERGLIPDDAKLRELEATYRGRFGGVRTVGTELVLGWLRRHGGISRAREGQLVASLYTSGYRILTLTAALRWWMTQTPPAPKLPIVFERLVRDLREAKQVYPSSQLDKRADLIIGLTIATVSAEMIGEVWAVEDERWTLQDRRHLATELLRAATVALESSRGSE